MDLGISDGLENILFFMLLLHMYAISVLILFGGLEDESKIITYDLCLNINIILS